MKNKLWFVDFLYEMSACASLEELAAINLEARNMISKNKELSLDKIALEAMRSVRDGALERLSCNLEQLDASLKKRQLEQVPAKVAQDINKAFPDAKIIGVNDGR